MTQNWVSRVVSSLVSMQNKNFGTVWGKRLFMKKLWIMKIFVCDFWYFFELELSEQFGPKKLHV